MEKNNREWFKAWREKNKERINKKRREDYAKKNPLMRTSKQTEEERKAKKCEYTKKWIAENPEKHKVAQKIRYEKKKDTPEFVEKMKALRATEEYKEKQREYRRKRKNIQESSFRYGETTKSRQKEINRTLKILMDNEPKK